MAERRMFTKKITESDSFLDMPSSTQVLYFHLNMSADDDGFVNNPKKIQRMVGSSDDDMKLLIAKRFILVFESGVIVIKHWKMHNYIQSDRYKPTDYIDEKGTLIIKQNKAYSLDVSSLDTKCVQDVSIGKDRLGKDRLGKDRLGNIEPAAPYFESELLNQTFLDYIDMRKKIKAPMTEHAIELAVAKLKKLAALPFSDDVNEDIAVEILNNSIMNSWKGLFPLKEEKKPTQSNEFDEWRNA